MTDLHNRRFTRVRVKWPVEMGDRQSSHRWDGQITEVSEGGGFVEVSGDHGVGTHVTLRFGFPLIDDVICIGVVRNHKPGVGVGVEFLRLSDTDRENISGLVQRGGKGSGDIQAPVA